MLSSSSRSLVNKNKSKLIWEQAESLLVSIHQVAAAICNCMFSLGGSTHKFPLPLGKVRDPI